MLSMLIFYISDISLHYGPWTYGSTYDKSVAPGYKMEPPVATPHLTHPERLLPSSPLPFPISYTGRIKTEEDGHDYSAAPAPRDTSSLYHQSLYSHTPQHTSYPRAQPPYNPYHETVPRLIHHNPPAHLGGAAAGNLSALAQIAFPTQHMPGTSSHLADLNKPKEDQEQSYSSKMKSSVVNQQLWRPY